MDTANPSADHAKAIRDFVVSNFLFGEQGSLQNDSSFMDGGILDSTGVLEFVAFLESTYGFKVDDREMIPENLDSVDRAAAFVTRRLAAKQAK